jgi:site-specific recombinase XerD
MTSDDDQPVGPAGSEPVGEHVRIFLRGRTWYANYQAGRKQHRVSLKTVNKKAAIRKALRIEAELAAGTWKPTAETATVDAAVAAYLEKLRADDLAAKTMAKYEMFLERIAAIARDRKVKDLDGIDLRFVDAYRAIRTKAGAQPKTVYNEAVFIRQLVNFALSRNLVAADPLRGFKMKKPRPTRQPCWTKDEVRTILDGSPPEVRPALALLAETGMRFGELAWLTWEDVDLSQKVVHIRPKTGWRLKTGDHRTVPLSAAALRVVEQLSRRHRWVVTMPPTAVVPTEGRQWTEKRLLTALQRVLKALKLEGKLHTFRHSFISHALLTNTPVAVVRKWVGHCDPKVIDLYTHVQDAASKAAMQRLSEADSQLQDPKKESQDGPTSDGPEAGEGSAQI